MSTEATIWAWKQAIPSSQKIVLLSMADRAGEDFRCWPSIKRLCMDTSLSERTVQQAICDIEKRGLIRRDMRTGRATVYFLIGVQGREDTPANAAPPQNLPTANAAGTPADAAPHPRKCCTQNLPVNLPRTPQGGESAQARTTPAQVEDPLPGKAGSKGKAKATGADATKQPFGEFGNVMLTATEHARLVQDYGAEEAEAAITFLDLHLGARKGSDPYKSHYLAMRKWVFQKLAEDRRKLGISKPAAPAQSGKSFNELTKQYRKAGGE